jgi:hypothetical protein
LKRSELVGSEVAEAGVRADVVVVATPLDLSELRRHKLVRKSFAHGLLNSHALEPVDHAA